MAGSCDVIVIFSIYGQFGAIRNKPYIFMNSNLLCCNKLKSKLKNIQHSSHTIALSKGTIFPQNADCLQREILTSAKLRRSWYWKFSETTYVFLRTYLGLKFFKKWEKNYFPFSLTFLCPFFSSLMDVSIPSDNRIKFLLLPLTNSVLTFSMLQYLWNHMRKFHDLI